MIAIEMPQNFLLSPECPKFSAAAYITTFVNSFISGKTHSDEVENSVQHYSYSSFGKLLKIENGGLDNTNNPAIKQPFTYTNREYDPELGGLYYYRARYYDSHSGRFMTEDPHPGSTKMPSTFNSAYTYVVNNPLNYRDPNGKIAPILIAMLVGAVIGGSVNAAFSKGNFFENFLIGAAAGAVAGAVGFGIGSMIGATTTFGGAVAKGALIGALSGGAATATSLLLSGEDITSQKNLGKIGLSIVIGGIVGGAFGAFSNMSPKEARPFVERGGEVQGEVYDTGAQEIYDYSIDIIDLECGIFAIGTRSHKACTGN